MSQREYTHVQMLLPEIKQMLASGKTQQRDTQYPLCVNFLVFPEVAIMILCKE